MPTRDWTKDTMGLFEDEHGNYPWPANVHLFLLQDVVCTILLSANWPQCYLYCIGDYISTVA